LSVGADSVLVMEIDVVGPWCGGVPPWLDAVFEGDLLAASDVEVLPVWDDVEVTVAELLVQVAAMAPGGAAISLLTSLSGRVLSADEKLTVVQLWQPLLAWAAGAETAAWLDFAGPETPADTGADPDRPAYATFTTAELAAGELGPALGCSTEFAQTRIAAARQLGAGGRFARVGDLLRAGQLSEYKTRLLLGELVVLAPPVAEAVQDAVLDRAGGLGPVELKRLVRRTGKRLAGTRDPEAVLTAFVAAQRSRRVWFDTDTVDGLVFLGAHLPPVEALAIQQLLNRDAGGRDCFDGRSHDEREADALMARLLGAQPAGGTSTDPDQPHRRGRGNRGRRGRTPTGTATGTATRAQVPVRPKIQLNVLVPLSTLLGGTDHPGELAGFGDLPPAVVRSLAADAQWRRWLYDDADGQLLDQGTQHYTPNAELDRLVRARDPQCRFPYSTRSSTHADLDHIEPFDTTGNGQGGSTSAANLAPLSRFPHRLKTHGGHTLRALGNGVLDWTTALGRTYRTRPHDYRPDPGTNTRHDQDGDDPPGV
jgi:hypothetical protein